MSSTNGCVTAVIDVAGLHALSIDALVHAAMVDAVHPAVCLDKAIIITVVSPTLNILSDVPHFLMIHPLNHPTTPPGAAV